MKQIYAVIKLGRLRSGKEQSGSIVHAVESVNGFALCGTSPCTKSVGWGIADKKEITCHKCLKKLEKVEYEFLENEGVNIGF